MILMIEPHHQWRLLAILKEMCKLLSGKSALILLLVTVRPHPMVPTTRSTESQNPAKEVNAKVSSQPAALHSVGCMAFHFQWLVYSEGSGQLI